MTIDTSRKAVERLLDDVTKGPWAWEETHPLNACASVTAKSDAGWNIGIATLYGDSDDVPTPTAPDEPWGDHPIRRANARFIAAARELVPALLAERDAALAEVARLSTPPDDAALAELVADLRATADAVRSGDGHLSEEIAKETEAVADALTRLSTALAAETDKREAMEEVLRLIRRADDLREEYHRLPNDRNRIGEKRSRKGHARDAWLRAFRKASASARATLAKHGSKT